MLLSASVVMKCIRIRGLPHQLNTLFFLSGRCWVQLSLIIRNMIMTFQDWTEQELIFFCFLFSIVCAQPFWIHDVIELLNCLTRMKYNERPYDVIKFKMVSHWKLTRNYIRCFVHLRSIKILIQSLYKKIEFAAINFSRKEGNKDEIRAHKFNFLKKFSDSNFSHPGLCSKPTSEILNFARLAAASCGEYRSFKTS